MKNKGVTAKDLLEKSSRPMVDIYVEDLVRKIDTEILTAHKLNKDSTTVELPTIFSINNMDKADAQTLIYSEIILLYKRPVEQGGRGFNVRIDIGIRTFIHIKWINGMNDEEKNQRKKIIRDVSIGKIRR
jgi:hypothetical protein